MHVVSVELRDFRSYSRADARLGDGLNVVHGANGAGKTNLLEALYYGCTGRSPRTRNERELVRFGAGAARVAVRAHDGAREHELTVGYGAGAGGPEKRMSCDGAPVERLPEVPCRPLVSVFLPDRLELVKGAPSLRRGHLDQLVAAIWPARADVRLQYARALAQRNALLARMRGRSTAQTTLAAWDRELARWAIALRDQRAEAAALLRDDLRARAAQLGCSGEVALEYRPRSRATGEDAFVAELQQQLAGDIERGFSRHGPHRDELAFVRDGRELRTYGSQGEQRLTLLALLLAERALLARERGSTPLMLLDDVMSELDGDRRELLVRELRGAGQSVIATTDLAHVPGAMDPAVTRLRVSGGAILQEAMAA